MLIPVREILYCLCRLAAERRLSSLDSFIQECLQVVTTMNANVAQQLLSHLQDDVTDGDQQRPVKPHGLPHEAHDESVSCIMHYTHFFIHSTNIS